MRYVKRRWIWNSILSWGMILTLCLSAFGFTQDDSRSQSAASAPAEEAALRVVVEKYFSAYGKKDLAGVVALWSEKSPDIVTHKQSLQKQFAIEDLSFGNPAVSRVKVRGERASLRVLVEQAANNLKSRQKREERLARNFEFVKEGGEWNVWRDAAAESDLAEALIKANSEAEREALLAAEKELVTGELVGALISQGSRLVNQGDYQQALAVYRLAQGIGEQIGDKAGITRVLNNTGVIHARQGTYEQALEYYRKSLAMGEALGSEAEMSRTLNNIGIVHRRQGNFEQALECYQKSLTMKETLGDKAGIANSLHNIGVVHNQQGNYVQALENYQKSLRMREALGDKAGMASSLHNIGESQRRQGSYEQSLEYIQKSLAMSEALGDKAGVARALGSIGNVHTSQGNYAQALGYLQKSLAIEEALGSEAEMSSTLNNIGVVHAQQGTYEQALEYFQKGLAREEALGDKAGTANALINIGSVYEQQGRYAQALEFAKRSAALASQISLIETLWEAHLTAGTSHRALNQPAKARQSFEEAITAIETLRTQVAGGEQEQQRFFESKVSPYHAMAELLIAQNNPAEALTYAERARARVLLDVLASGRTNITGAMSGQEQEQQRRLNNQIISLNSQVYYENLRPQPDPARLVVLNAQLGKARLDYEAFQTSLYAAHPELKTQRGEAHPLRLEQVSDLLPDAKTALLEFVVAEGKIYLFVITKQVKGKPATAGVKVYPLTIKQKDITDRVEHFRGMLAAVDNRFSKPARDLYDLLLKPAAEQLQGKSRLVIVPDGPLWELPFQALQTPQDRYLIEDCTIFYAPSLTVLREMINARSRKIKPAAEPTLLALGNPALGNQTIARVKAVLMNEKLDSLPEAERQVQMLGKIYGSSRSKVYVGAEAREERFKAEAKDYRILHLATHGILNDRSPMYSHVLLAQTGEGTKEDGLLEAWELMKMDLKSELAVLSACETARGRVGRGEGMLGLTWAMFVAGVPTTVVSQWKVRSDSTTELMVEFHRRLRPRLTGSPTRTSAAKALRSAALKLKSDSRYQHPFHWASFVVVGDGY